MRAGGGPGWSRAAVCPPCWPPLVQGRQGWGGSLGFWGLCKTHPGAEAQAQGDIPEHTRFAPVHPCSRGSRRCLDTFIL